MTRARRSNRRDEDRLRVSKVALLAAACAASIACSTPPPPVASPPPVARAGHPAQNFVSQDIDGNMVRLSDYLGREPILLDFCATWCQPCIAEMPHLRDVYDRDKDELVMFAIALESNENMAEVPLWARRNNVPFPVIFDEGSKIASFYNPQSFLPLKVLIDRTGTVAYIHRGYMADDEEAEALENQIASAIASPALPQK